MKKVYGSLITVFCTGCFFIIPIFAWFYGNRYELSQSKEFIILLIILLGASVIFAFISYWAYGEDGIELFSVSGKSLNKYSWKDVLSITHYSSPTFSLIGWVILEMKDSKRIAIGYFITRNFLRVLSDVVRYSRKYSPDTFTSQWVDKKVERYL